MVCLKSEKNNCQQRTKREKDKQLPTKDKKRKRQTIVNKGQTETKTNNSQQRTKREKDKQWSAKDKKRKRQTMVNKGQKEKKTNNVQHKSGQKTTND